jgi:hypothetical protein
MVGYLSRLNVVKGSISILGYRAACVQTFGYNKLFYCTRRSWRTEFLDPSIVNVLLELIGHGWQGSHWRAI